jgi:hypothetical protein
VHIDVHTLGGQWNARKLLSLLIAHGSASLRSRLRLLLCIYGVLGNAYNRLFFSMAGNQGDNQEPGQRRNPGRFSMGNHTARISARETLVPRRRF